MDRSSPGLLSSRALKALFPACLRNLLFLITFPCCRRKRAEIFGGGVIFFTRVSSSTCVCGMMREERMHECGEARASVWEAMMLCRWCGIGHGGSRKSRVNETRARLSVWMVRGGWMRCRCFLSGGNDGIIESSARGKSWEVVLGEVECGKCIWCSYEIQRYLISKKK